MNAQPPLPAPIMSERRVGIIGAMLVAIGPTSMALYTPAMPEIVHAFGTTEAMVKMSLTLYFAGFAFAQLICGPLSDGLGRRPVTVAFMGIYTIASIAAVFAPDIHTLIAARFVQGVGAAVGVAISRAIVRDLFASEQSARIMNLIGIILVIAPATAPTIGGLTMELAGWHAIFIVMAAAGIGIALLAIFSLKETVTRDLGRIRPKALIKSYKTLVRSTYFMSSSLMIAGTAGALYAMATMLPFVLIERVGLTPSQFGFGMLLQSGGYLTGSLLVRQLMKRYSAYRIVPIGLISVAIGGLAFAVLLRIFEPTFLNVMIPAGFYAFGIAFVMPAISTAALAPFPHMAGAASSMLGFLQMGAGLVGGLIAAAMGAPVIALATIIPGMAVLAILSWVVWRRLPEPTLLVLNR
jgi:DHA1 family bicyclomycin/chloramphenicol resistance-like MFS transporter